MEKRLDNLDLRNLLGEFMSGNDIARLERYLQEEGALQAKKLMDGLSHDETGVNAYRHGIQLCMRHAYWQADRMQLVEQASMVDAFGGVWVPPENEVYMLYMALNGKMLSIDEPEHEEVDLLMAMGFVDALQSLRAFAVAA